VKQHAQIKVPGLKVAVPLNVMFISENPEPTGNLFERNDDYYIYLKPQELSEDEVRRRNGWKEGALVSRWIAMPAH
jgi:hypothetical protein